MRSHSPSVASHMNRADPGLEVVGREQWQWAVGGTGRWAAGGLQIYQDFWPRGSEASCNFFQPGGLASGGEIRAEPMIPLHIC